MLSRVEFRSQLRHLRGRATLCVVQFHAQVRNLCSRSLLNFAQLIRKLSDTILLGLQLRPQIDDSRIPGRIALNRQLWIR